MLTGTGRTKTSSEIATASIPTPSPAARRVFRLADSNAQPVVKEPLSAVPAELTIAVGRPDAGGQSAMPATLRPRRDGRRQNPDLQVGATCTAEAHYQGGGFGTLAKVKVCDRLLPMEWLSRTVEPTISALAIQAGLRS